MLRVVTRSANQNVMRRINLLRLYSSYPAYTVINMPALSPTMTHGNLANWSKKEGDQLAVGEVLAEVETDKAVMDFEFQDDGYLAKLLVEEGAKDIPVNKPIAIYVEEAGDVAAFKDFKLPASSESSASSQATEAPAKKSFSKSTAAPAISTGSAPVASTPVEGARIIASPLAKLIALENGIALRNVKGTGPHGRIVKADVDSFMASGKAAVSTPIATSAPPVAPTPSDLFEDIEISNMRKIIGNRLLQSTQGIPSYLVSSDISVSKLLKLRASLNNDPTKSSGIEYKLSINDILIKSISLAAKRVPEVNSYWLENENVIRQFKNVDVSVAVATPTGLITPIIKNANSKGLVSISKEVKDLVKRAKINKLAPEEFQGGTICISNLGMNNAVSMFTSIINPPQSTILAIGTTKRVPIEDVIAKNGISFHDVVNITGTFDHRTVDGAKAGEFMRELKKIIENPLQLLL